MDKAIDTVMTYKAVTANKVIDVVATEKAFDAVATEEEVVTNEATSTLHHDNGN